MGAAKFLAYMCDTEHFQTHVGDYFPDDAAKAAFVALQVRLLLLISHYNPRCTTPAHLTFSAMLLPVQDEVVGPIVADRAVERKDVRPLMDAIMKMKRSM